MNHLQFLEQLAGNNNRPWFQSHKPLYDKLREAWLDDLDRLIANMATWAPELKYVSGSDCAYRIYRDTRFSPDKTPYKTYFSALISPRGRHCGDMAAFYVHSGITPGESGLFGGLWNPPSQVLRKVRNAIVDNHEEFEEILAAPGIIEHFPEWCGRSLKTAPKGWPKDHPQIRLLRLVDIGKCLTVENDFFLDQAWPEIAAERLSHLKPLLDFLNYSITEEI